MNFALFERSLKIMKDLHILQVLYVLILYLSVCSVEGLLFYFARFQHFVFQHFGYMYYIVV